LAKDKVRMKDKRIVVTGGAGFIGSHLAEGFSEENDVVIVDNLSTGRLENIKQLIALRKVKFIRGDACDPRLMGRACKDADHVFHCAAVPSVPLSVKNPLLANRSGVDATLSSLLAARDAGVEKFIFASSSAVYGNPESLPIREDAPLSPLSPYAVTKIAGEQYCRLFSELYGLGVISLRFFNVFGPRQDPKSEYAAVVPRFISKALSSRKLTIFGDGRQTRDFLFVKDVILAHQLAAKKGAEGVYNISSGRSVTINELAETILKVAGKNVAIAHEPRRIGEIMHSRAEVSKAKAELGFEPRYSLEEGLAETMAAYGRKGR
jgi:UDP-glucose 4-epimerase